MKKPDSSGKISIVLHTDTELYLRSSGQANILLLRKEPRAALDSEPLTFELSFQ